MLMKYILPSLIFLTACGNGTLTAKSNNPPGTSDGTGSEIATSVLNGALSGGGSSNGSHLKGTLSPPVGKSTTFWDHTVSTQTPGMTIIGIGSSKIANGSIVVQHNLAKFTTTSTFSGVAYGDANCCFPTAGSVTTVFSGSANDTKSETLAFSGPCGETTLTQPNGAISKITLVHCL